MHVLTGHKDHSSRRSSKASGDDSRQDSNSVDDETVVEPDSKWLLIVVSSSPIVLSHIISQLRPGADLSRVVLPTFILEPRSMLERITNFMAHPETLLPMPDIDDPVQRFVSVVKFYLSGWHIKPPGVKKPLNPILGETFTCYWDYPDHTHGYYISEQTSHHPPKSSYFFMAPEHNIRIDGTLKPRSKFLGNSAASLMEGIAILRFMNRGKSRGGEKYILTQPNMYARGILFGKMKYELGDHSFVRCPEQNLVANIEFKTKGYFGGTYNAIGGVIKNEKTGETLYELSGMWSGEMTIKNMATGKKELLFNATHARHTPPITRPLEEQGDRESQKLWYKTVVALKEGNQDVATDEKTRIEDMQREEAAKRAESGREWQPRYFRAVQGGPGGQEEGEEDLDWILNANIDGPTSDAKVKQILAMAPIVKGQHASQQGNAAQRGQQPQQPQQHQQLQQSQQVQQTSLPAQNAQQQFGGHSDLIDLGQGVPQAQFAPPQRPAQQQTMQGTYTSGPGIQAPLHPEIGEPIVRRDTNTGAVDEFVDAEEP
ncbi:oxysterol-binding protein [Lasallia pustulata]|uniref:Oxysterol-binding protein n=1 Tax=Lasallia pustulata TaxID=136370 RepID=A0A1W5D8C9_9LECA|nr:oxysterol-binding protein [Lasallia pustulata]